MSWRLRLTGEVDVDRRLRTENEFSPFYRRIDDALVKADTNHGAYSLLLASSGERFPRRAYFRLSPEAHPQETRRLFKISVKKEAVAVSQGGRLGVEVAVYLKRPGRNQDDISGKPDEISFLNIGEGSADWRELTLPVRVDPQVSCLLFTIVGQSFRGRVWLEHPRFPGDDSQNDLPPFAPVQTNDLSRNWLGENLSRTEWPEFRLSLNGKEFFQGPIYQPVYAWPSAEVDIPNGLLRPGANQLTIQLLSNYRDALPFVLKGVAWLGVANGRLELVACPKLVDAGGEFAVTLATREVNQTVRVSVISPRGAPAIQPISPEIVYAKPGLNFVRFRTAAAGPGALLRFQSGTDERTAVIERVVERPEDGILLGSSDSMYVPAESEPFQRFHAWYLQNDIGNAIMYRPIYRWGGGRVLNTEAWKEAVRICEGAGLKYVRVLDGRELPGIESAPTDEMLRGPLFLGSQLHEYDGMYNYWGIRRRQPHEALFWDVYQRFPSNGRAWGAVDPKVLGGPAEGPLFYDSRAAADMRDGAQHFVNSIKALRDRGVRHSGPSTLFKYFFQAGFDWLAAETMYGPHEVVLGALRGSSLAYNRPRYGVHIATQWSSSPHDTESAFRRYFLTLATSYLQAVEYINQEDALWHMEANYSAEDRFSTACRGHLKVHQEFYSFLRSHSRRGRMRVPVGFLQGQYDGWNCFSGGMVWGQEGAEWDSSAPEKSWGLLKLFFPRSVLEAIYRHPIPDEPVGFFTGTPYGPADLVPVEADAKALGRYRSLVLLGWNTADREQLGRLLSYVENGGHLLLALPHVSTEVRRRQAPKPAEGPEMRKLLGLEYRGLTQSEGAFTARRPADQHLAAAVAGRRLRLGQVVLNGALVRIADRRGTPLLIENRIGRGAVTLVNAAAYPGEEALAPLYRLLVRGIGEDTLSRERRSLWVKGSEDVSFAVYDWEKAADAPQISTAYLLNVNWWDRAPQPRPAKLLWRDSQIPLSISRDRIHIITVSGDWGIWTADARTDVMDVRPEGSGVRIKLQGQGETQISLLSRASGARSLCGSTSRGPLPLSPSATPGLWQAVLTLDGPEVLKIGGCPAAGLRMSHPGRPQPEVLDSLGDSQSGVGRSQTSGPRTPRRRRCAGLEAGVLLTIPLALDPGGYKRVLGD